MQLQRRVKRDRKGQFAGSVGQTGAPVPRGGTAFVTIPKAPEVEAPPSLRREAITAAWARWDAMTPEQRAEVDRDTYARHGGTQAALDARRVAAGTAHPLTHNRHQLNNLLADLEADPSERRIAGVRSRLQQEMTALKSAISQQSEWSLSDCSSLRTWVRVPHRGRERDVIAYVAPDGGLSVGTGDTEPTYAFDPRTGTWTKHDWRGDDGWQRCNPPAFVCAAADQANDAAEDPRFQRFTRLWRADVALSYLRGVPEHRKVDAIRRASAVLAPLTGRDA